MDSARLPIRIPCWSGSRLWIEEGVSRRVALYFEGDVIVLWFGELNWVFIKN